MDLDLNGQKLFNYRKEDINISESIQFKKIPTKESKINSNIDISPEKLNIPAQIQLVQTQSRKGSYLHSITSL